MTRTIGCNDARSLNAQAGELQQKALLHPRRQRILSYVAKHPAATFRELVRETGIAAGSLRHHVNVLLRADLLVERNHGMTLRYFDKQACDTDWQKTVLLREAPIKAIYDWLRANPESPQKVILAAMEAQGVSRSSVQHRLRRLQKAGLVTVRPQGRLKIYTAHASVQPQGGRHSRPAWERLSYGVPAAQQVPATA